MEQHLRDCEVCSSLIRPDIVLHRELLNQITIYNALDKINDDDTLVVLGSSLLVQPAAGLISNFKGQNLIIINNVPTPYDNYTTLVIHDDMVKVVNELEYVE